ncbi:hypothetical protein P8833_19240 [Bacillus inaquosorum]|uniref:hypothetical protein n=1 Tax=Bacillus inaquosorum TaxID=483913 RepID=UPI002DB78655|nr:hypothetical protein [Bacillus inaquosorum]MEC0575871.1 hypothetical protein [Bacillus inaquosorum]MED1170665.1 hypothetical protein [Bacillus inaquosorum]MED1543066.1 hypothetical protein [Bacillus inaquosorum]
MKLQTAQLLTILSEYQFFDWEHQKNNKHRIMIGLPENMLIIKEFYQSFGFDSVENPYSNIKISNKQWVHMEDLFFQLISPYLSTFRLTIVTPFLSNDWEGECHLDDIMDDEFADAYKAYKAFLIGNGLYGLTPTLIDYCRGYQIDHIGDFSILGKMAARNHHYLFFADGDKVFMFTDSLTFRMYCKDGEVLHNEKRKIEQLLNPDFLYESLWRTHKVSAFFCYSIDVMDGNVF